MPELLRAHRGGMRELFGAQEGVCRSLWWLKGGYAETFVCSRGGIPEVLWAQDGLCRNFCGLGGVCRNYCGLRGGMPELLGA